MAKRDNPFGGDHNTYNYFIKNFMIPHFHLNSEMSFKFVVELPPSMSTVLLPNQNKKVYCLFHSVRRVLHRIEP